MKKVMIVIFVLSLLGLVAVPVLAKILTESEPHNEVAPRDPGTTRRAEVESLMLAEGLIREGGPSNELCPPPGTVRPAGLETPLQVAGFWRAPAPRS